MLVVLRRTFAVNFSHWTLIIMTLSITIFIPYFIEYSAHFFTLKMMLDCLDIFLVDTWKVAEKKFKMAFIMNKLAMINFLEN